MKNILTIITLMCLATIAMAATMMPTPYELCAQYDPCPKEISHAGE